MGYGCMLYEMKNIAVKKLVIIMACENGECVVMKKLTKPSISDFLVNTSTNLSKTNWSFMEPSKELEKAMESKFLTPTKFSMEIEKIVAEEKLNYIDAICQYCEMNDIEIQSVTKLITKPLKERLKYDAIQLNFMKKTSRAKLPL